MEPEPDLIPAEQPTMHMPPTLLAHEERAVANWLKAKHTLATRTASTTGSTRG